MADDSTPERRAGEVCACAHRLDQRGFAVDVCPGEAAPSGYTTIEVTIPPGALDDRGRVPRAIPDIVYDGGPWTLGIVDVSRRAVDLVTVLIR